MRAIGAGGYAKICKHMVDFQDTARKKEIDEMREKEAERLAEILAERYDIPYVNLSRVIIDNSAIRIIPEAVAREAKVVIFQESQKTVGLAVQTPHNEKLPSIMEELRRQGYNVNLFIASEYAIARAWEVYKEVSYAKAETAGVVSISDETMQKYVALISSIADVKEQIENVLKEGDMHALSTVVEIIMGGAVACGVSDVHLDPEKEFVRVRYRLDGVLQDVAQLSREHYRKVLARMKLMAGVKLNVTAEAQDGRFTIKIQGVDVEVRFSIIPARNAESVVMRILNPKSINVPLEELGMDDEFYKIMVEQIEKPNGLILTTGPTGSGKTTTLYACLRKLRDPQVKIITIEDPIEYHLEGVSQTQVDHSKGYDFVAGLRAAVRQDPDVIMVGEIRDEETASVAIDSALTGHVVFSTLHTNNAAGAIPRLIDLGVNPKILSSALNIAIGQRLVRRLCVACKIEYVPEGEELEALESALPNIRRLRPNVKYEGKLWKPAGCDKCSFTGYKGRISIYEGILMNAAIEEVLRVNPSEREIWEAAKPQGILTMREDGIVKAIKGITSIEEVKGAVGLRDLR